jgi:hypothetical protein
MKNDSYDNIYKDYSKKIEDLKSLSNSNQAIFEERSHKRTLLIEIIKYFSTIIALIAAFAGITLTAINYFSVLGDIDKTILFQQYLFLGIFILILLLIFSLLYWLVIRLISKNISQNYLGYSEVSKEMKNYCEILIAQNALNNLLTENIHRAPVSHLITWRNSADIEYRSRIVWSISYTLQWLNDNRIKCIIEELVDKRDNEYKFIYIGDNESDGLIIKDRVDSIISSTIISLYKNKKDILKIRERFRIEIAKNRKIPIPNDVCIYREFQEGFNNCKEIVVINMKEFEETENCDIDNNYDLKFENEKSRYRVKSWFIQTWNEITGENLE